MTIPASTQPTGKIRVGIIGAGPAGLAAAIFLNRLDFVSVDIFDQARELREVGAGISINQNTWRLLKLLGADSFIEQHSRRGDSGKIDGEQRDGATGELLQRKYQSVDPNAPPRSRIERYKLQQALLAQIPAGTVQLSKRLASIEHAKDGTALTFQDGESAGPYDLIVGADGLRSVVREHAFPDHRLSYTGKVAFRTLIPQSAVAHIPDLPRASTFWHLPDLHVYTDFLDNGLFEIATRANLPEEHGEKVSWGQKIDKEQVVPHYQGFSEQIRQVIDTPDEWLEFAMFGGPRLETVIHGGRIALLGDASHPLSGAFGSGAAFAFEDAYVLAAALQDARTHDNTLASALEVYDEVRIPRYADLHGVLDTFGKNAKQICSAQHRPSDREIVRKTVELNWSASNEFIYTYDVTKVWAAHNAERQTANTKEEDGAERPSIASSANAAAAPNVQPILVQ